MRIADELVSLANEIGDKEREFEGHGYRLFAALETGNIEDARRELAVKERIADELGQPSQHWWILSLQAGFAIAEGDIEHAELLSAQAQEVGMRSQARDGDPAFALQHTEIRRQQGRAAEAEELLIEAANAFTWYPMFRCALARHYAEGGRHAEADAIVQQLVSADAVHLPFDNEWLYGVSVLAETAACLGDQRAAAVLYREMLPYKEHLAVAPAELVGGSVALPLGLLATTLQNLEDAEGHFLDAVRVNRRVGVRLWLTQAQHDYARMLLQRRGFGDVETARALAEEALATACELKLVALDQKLTALIASLETEVPGRQDARPATSGSCDFLREGEYWAIGPRGKAMRLKDSKGLDYIARLLASPGEEIHALDLLAGGSAPAGKSAKADLAEQGVRTARANGGDVLDSQARQAYRSRLEELREEIAEAEDWNDPERGARAREEMDFITDELSQSMGLGGRSRQETSDVERARQSVTKAIKQALGRIAKHDPQLAEMLGRSVRTGLFCRYEPALADGVTWRL
jgi:tetratricopeptide (TPR) repeat protein